MIPATPPTPTTLATPATTIAYFQPPPLKRQRRRLFEGSSPASPASPSR
jgi:hypothetical protein